MIEIISPNFGTLQIIGESEHTAADQSRKNYPVQAKPRRFL